MSLAYSKCRIHFIPTDKRRSTRKYSDRSLIEVRLNNVGGYLLRGVDIENQSEEIFQFHLIRDGLYEFGYSNVDYDEIHCKGGTYRLWLNDQLRDAFHKELREILARPVSPQKNSPDIKPEKNQSVKSSTMSKKIKDQNKILVDIHKLSESIQNSEDTKASNLARKLVKNGVKLQLEESAILPNDEIFPIKVRIDGLDLDIEDRDDEYILNVYPSTKVRELRAMFESACQFPSAKQYFFVNGHLAYAESTMKDLDVKENSLFVLFLAEKYSKSHRF